jgi:hypothetical protein
MSLRARELSDFNVNKAKQALSQSLSVPLKPLAAFWAADIAYVMRKKQEKDKC